MRYSIRWARYALVLDQKLTLQRGTMPGHWDWPLAPPLKVTAKAKKYCFILSLTVLCCFYAKIYQSPACIYTKLIGSCGMTSGRCLPGCDSHHFGSFFFFATTF